MSMWQFKIAPDNSADSQAALEAVDAEGASEYSEEGGEPAAVPGEAKAGDAKATE